MRQKSDIRYGTVYLECNSDENRLKCILTRSNVVRRKKDSEIIYDDALEYFYQYSMCAKEYKREDIYQDTLIEYDLGMILVEKVSDDKVIDIITGKEIISSEKSNNGELCFNKFLPLSKDKVLAELRRISRRDINIKAYITELNIIERKTYEAYINGKSLYVSEESVDNAKCNIKKILGHSKNSIDIR